MLHYVDHSKLPHIAFISCLLLLLWPCIVVLVVVRLICVSSPPCACITVLCLCCTCTWVGIVSHVPFHESGHWSLEQRSCMCCCASEYLDMQCSVPCSWENVIHLVYFANVLYLINEHMHCSLSMIKRTVPYWCTSALCLIHENKLLYLSHENKLLHHVHELMYCTSFIRKHYDLFISTHAVPYSWK